MQKHYRPHLYDYDRRHFIFERQTKTPRGAFDVEATGHYWVGILCAVIATVLLVLAFTGAFS